MNPTTIEVLNKLKNEFEFALKSAEVKRLNLYENTEEYYKNEGVIIGLYSSLDVLNLTIIICS